MNNNITATPKDSNTNTVDEKFTNCVNYMYSQLPMYHRIGAAAYKEDLNNTIALCNHFGNPQNGLKCIHIAGTNGKTSISHILASILQHAGYKTALYTSPHLVDFRERIMINGAMIDKEYVCNFIDDNKSFFETLHPSFFEITVALAFCYFRDCNVDYAVIEVGLGGRLDSTNIITPFLSVITNIGLEHTQFLGDTIPKIAKEKAGIIKDNIPVVIGETQADTIDVFKTVAIAHHAPIYFADTTFEVSDIQQSIDKLEFNALNKNTLVKYHVNSKLVGHYEIKNICTSLVAVEICQSLGINIPLEAIYEGLKTTVLRGRWDIIHRDPVVVCDIGHNAHGLKTTLEMINLVKYDKLHIVFGAVNDKDLSKIVYDFPKDAKYYFCQPDLPRAMDVEVLAEHFATAGIIGKKFVFCIDALKDALTCADKNDLIYVGGSNFVVADILKAI